MARKLLDIFAANMRVRRAAKKMTQESLAAAIGVSVSYVSMLERGQRSPPFDTVEKVAKALGSTPVGMLTP